MADKKELFNAGLSFLKEKAAASDNEKIKKASQIAEAAEGLANDVVEAVRKLKGEGKTDEEIAVLLKRTVEEVKAITSKI